MKLAAKIEHWPALPSGKPDVEGINSYLQSLIRELEKESTLLGEIFEDRLEVLENLLFQINSELLPGLTEDEIHLVRIAVQIAVSTGRQHESRLNHLIKKNDLSKLGKIFDRLPDNKMLYAAVRYSLGFAEFAEAASCLQSVCNAVHQFQNDLRNEAQMN